MEQYMVTVSIIMGIYNITDLQILQKAIVSIRKQTFTDWEWIICDDGSTDNTYQMLQSLVKEDERIRLIKNRKNLGLAASLNHCLKYAKGKYIARMDADDISDVHRFSKQIDFLEQHSGYDFVGTAAWLFNEKGIWGGRRMPQRPDKTDLLWGPPFIHATIMMRKKTLVQIGGYRVAKETRRTEDYDLFMRLYAEGYSGYNLSENLYYIREDKKAIKRKKYRYRLDEAKVRVKGFCQLGLMPKGMVYIIKPLVVGLIPYPILVWLRKDKRKR